MLDLCPAGFEEVDRGEIVELVAYADAESEQLLARAFGRVSAKDVEVGWEGRWREFHRPVEVGRLWVGPPWETPPDDRVPVVIDPGRAFGTGAHASTRLCLELLQRIPPARCLDVGCGSGVIAVAAAKLGFEPVVAVDVDEHAVEATRRNAAANDVVVRAVRADACVEPLPSAAVAVANLTHELALQILPRLDCDVVVAAGYLDAYKLHLPSFRLVERLVEDGWAADLLERAAQ